jgi:hypothetical protein
MQFQAGDPGNRTGAFRWDAAPFRRRLLRDPESAGEFAEQAFPAEIGDGSVEVWHARDRQEVSKIYSR